MSHFCFDAVIKDHDQKRLMEEFICAYGFRRVIINHNGEAWSQIGMVAGGESQESIYSTRSRKERADRKWGEIMHFQSPSLVIYFLQQRFTSWTLSSRATKWKPSVQIPEPVEDISHSNDNNTIHKLFRKLTSLAMDEHVHDGAPKASWASWFLLCAMQAEPVMEPHDSVRLGGKSFPLLSHLSDLQKPFSKRRNEVNSVQSSQNMSDHNVLSDEGR